MWCTAPPPVTLSVRAVRVRWLSDTFSTRRRLRSALATPRLRIRPKGSASSRLSPGSSPSTARVNNTQVSSWSSARPRATWSMRVRPASLSPGPASSRMKSVSYNPLAPSASGTKWIRLPPGATMAGTRSSFGPTGLSWRSERMAVARPTAASGSAQRTPSAHTEVPCASNRWRANESGCALTMKWMPPWRYSVTALERWRPTRRKPSCPSSAPSVTAEASSAANSMNDSPESTGAGGGLNSSTRCGCTGASLAASRSRVSLSRYSSERIASTAVRRFGVSRKMSLKISSDSGPV
ncbi:hypothetical protein D9M68_725180 [compost metagenome]